MEVTIPAADGAPETPAFAVVPEGATRGVVVIHEIMGRRPEIDRVVERFARAGYAAVAPDLFHRGRFTCLRETFAAMKSGQGVPVTQGKNARSWLCQKAKLEPSKVGLIGFCFGGGFALTAGSGWAAVSTNYGQVPSEKALRGIGAVIGCYGTRDKSMSSQPAKLEQRLREIDHDPAEIHFFDAGHSFLTDAEVGWRKIIPLMSLGDYPDAREEGWRRIFAFFERQL